MHPDIRTRLLILSDTHGEAMQQLKHLPRVDVAIHCGDLTEESMLYEMQIAIALLNEVKADLKLVIAGNHDFTLDVPFFRKKVTTAQPPLDPDLVKQTFGCFGEAVSLFEAAKGAGIMILNEGTHRISLSNNALLTVYASPFTASMSEGGFTYLPKDDHEWHIQQGTDIAITHGPPRGIFDYTDSKERAGSQSLFAAVARAQPKVHCFGHIHEAWGAKLVQWRETLYGEESPSHFTSIDNERSSVIETLASLEARKYDTPQMVREKEQKREAYYRAGVCHSNRIPSDQQTLFVNAAVESAAEGLPQQLPWMIEVDLPSRH